jgi:hypothetical protein
MVRAPGAQALAHALTRNSTLCALDLRLNRLGDDGGQVGASVLPYQCPSQSPDTQERKIFREKNRGAPEARYPHPGWAYGVKGWQIFRAGDIKWKSVQTLDIDCNFFVYSEPVTVFLIN